MAKAKILFSLGVWVAVLPYLGFPFFIKNILFTLSGIALVYFSYFIYRDERPQEPAQKTYESFSENHDFVEPRVASSDPAGNESILGQERL